MKIYQVNAFATEPLTGNPAAVCILNRKVSDQWMQNLAMEMNQSETAYIIPEEGGFLLRWFKPTCEIEICGHGTLAAAHVLWEEGVLGDNEAAKFRTLKSGVLTALKRGKLIELNFPIEQEKQLGNIPEELINGLGKPLKYVGESTYRYLVRFDSEEDIMSIRPNFNELHKLSKRGVIVTSPSLSLEYDFVSRYFGASSRGFEDPVTGSAHCVLAPFWGPKLNKKELSAFQLSNRGGYLNLKLEGERVLIRGEACTIFKGELLI